MCMHNSNFDLVSNALKKQFLFCLLVVCKMIAYYINIIIILASFLNISVNSVRAAFPKLPFLSLNSNNNEKPTIEAIVRLLLEESFLVIAINVASYFT